MSVSMTNGTKERIDVMLGILPVLRLESKWLYNCVSCVVLIIEMF